MTAAPQSTAMTTDELFRQHAAFVGRFLARLGVPAEHIPDALQEVFLVVHRQGGYRPGIAKPTSYLAGVALHAARKHRRRQQLDRARHSETGADQLATGGADPIRRMQVQQDLERLQHALDHLSEEHRTALVLIEIEGESCLSVAAALGVPVGTMYSRVHVARKKLQLALRWVDGQRPMPSRGRRLERAPSLGMFAWFGLDALVRRSEANRLLQVAREQPPALEGADALLARHRELVQGGAELPSWAAQYVPHSATWAGVLSLGSVAAVTSLTAAGVIAAVVIGSARPNASAASRLQPSAAEAIGARGAPSLVAIAQPSAADAPVPVTMVTTPDEQAAQDRTPEAESRAGTRARTPDASLRPAAARDDTRTASAAAAASHPTVASETRAASSARAPRTASSAAAASHPTAARETRAASSAQASRAASSAAAALHAEAAAEPRAASSAQAASHARARDAGADTTQQPTAATTIRLPAPMPGDYRPVDSMQEMRDVAGAEHLLATNPALALQAARAIRARFPDGYLHEERAYVEVMALVKLARTEEARAEADAFLSRYPDGPYSQRVRSAVQGAPR